ncbi:MAG: hypothetical protein KF760_01425 [Candidatus Eremiobacteraeota bacterium]|nr:hypothetical protein [Candidatus Eremiobacteraeota bacterium]MCW5869772.1 hypothetical protein [Candidatus Eremiobacteraeota bacterium]
MKKNFGKVILGGSLFLLGMLTSQVMADQPHMQNAKENLRLAREELRMAEANKGGHRERALELIDEAIDQVQQGIDYAR